MILATAQTHPKIQDLEFNSHQHVQLIELASVEHADLILFPELSLTGYFRTDPEQHAYVRNDDRLAMFDQLAISCKMTIAIGLPFDSGKGIHIATMIFGPKGNRKVYTKRHLHGEEAVNYQACHNFNPQLDFDGLKASFAICYDIHSVDHAADAKAMGSALYLASIFYSHTGIQQGHDDLASYARELGIGVLMANYCRKHWDLEAGGRSAYWNQKGQLVGELDENRVGLLIIDTESEKLSRIYL